MGRMGIVSCCDCYRLMVGNGWTSSSIVNRQMPEALTTRASFFLAAACGLLFWGQAAFAGPPTAADWASYNYDARGWRWNSAEQSLSPENARQLEEKWRYPPLGSELTVGAIHATPSVVNGHVYFGTATYPAFYKLRPDGTLAWKYSLKQDRSGRDAEGANNIDLDSGVLASALVTERSVFFGNSAGRFFALDRTTGEERWQVDSRAESFPNPHLANTFMASPIWADGKVIVGGGSYEHPHPSDPEYPCCTGRGFVIAFEPTTGKIVWKYDVGEQPQEYPEPIAIEDARGKHLFRFGPSTSSVWSTPSYDEDSQSIFFGTDVHNSPRQPTDEDPRVYSKYSAAVICVDVLTGNEKWVTQLNQGDVYNLRMSGYDPNTRRYKDNSIGDTPKIYTISWKGRLTKVVGVGCKNGGFYVLRADNGEILSHTPLYLGEPNHPRQPARDPRTIALPSPIGGIQTGCATDGRSVFTNGIDWLSLNRPLPGAPEAGRVVSITSDLLKENWRHERPKVGVLLFSSGDPIGSGIALGGGLACFTTTASKKLVVLNAATGETLKSISVGIVWSGPSISRGRIYVGTGSVLFLGQKMNGTLISFGLPGRDQVEEMGRGNE